MGMEEAKWVLSKGWRGSAEDKGQGQSELGGAAHTGHARRCISSCMKRAADSSC